MPREKNTSKKAQPDNQVQNQQHCLEKLHAKLAYSSHAVCRDTMYVKAVRSSCVGISDMSSSSRGTSVPPHPVEPAPDRELVILVVPLCTSAYQPSSAGAGILDPHTQVEKTENGNSFINTNDSAMLSSALRFVLLKLQVSRCL